MWERERDGGEGEKEGGREGGERQEEGVFDSDMYNQAKGRGETPGDY